MSRSVLVLLAALALAVACGSECNPIPVVAVKFQPDGGATFADGGVLECDGGIR
jgi:hypothetical protein